MNPLQLAVRVLRHDSRTRTSAILTAAGVMVATALVLILTALPNAAQARTERSSWQHGHQGVSDAGGVELASQDYVQGELITRLDVSGTPGGGKAPKYPAPGEVLLSPALAQKVADLPDDALADRFPERIAGTIDPQQLRYPEQLVAVVGHPEGVLDQAAEIASPYSLVTIKADSEDLLLQPMAWFGLFILAAPSLVLVASASRLTAARREHRMASLRMAGATPSQVVSTVAAETGLAAAAGTVAGLLLTWPLRYLVALVPWGSGTWLVSDITPSIWAVLGVAIGVPALVVASSVLGAGRVVRAPLSAATQQQRGRPKAWRLLIIAVVAGFFLLGMIKYDEGAGFLVLVVPIVGVVWSFSLVGPWITATIGRLFTRVWRRPSVLLAGRRLVSDPKSAYRSSSGMVLAVFIGALALTALPAMTAGPDSMGSSNKQGVILADVSSSQAPELRQRLADELARLGVRATAASYEKVSVEGPGGEFATGLLIDCRAAREVTPYQPSCEGPPRIHVPSDMPTSELAVTPAVAVKNPLATPVPPGTPVAAEPNLDAAIIDPGAVPALAGSQQATLTVLPPTEADRATVRTAMARVVPGADIESIESRSVASEVMTGDLHRITVIGLSIASVLAAGSAAITAAGAVIDRRRTLGALIAAGTQSRVLVRALHVEAALPALVAAGMATAAGAGVGLGLLNALQQSTTLTPSILAPIVLGLLVAALAATASGLMLRKITAEPLADE
ncbi:ABC transporter permease [Saccharopolyspora sp. NFXS83]|uniref:FtsX-like permease family protein n=1 Tax=Saccharopolyspora sp. NFXS83 TaxID=2993560 RepID=UPI00224B71D6|nr:FtsX-like permease family protein [Saccharopolyspora sp. NFXS83]MCX2729819.1 ABC transporter permease [Saccharopolyspora sp. NFXS83]